VQHLPFDKPGRFYRGNLHSHSTASDGMLEPAEVIRRYREQGYDFVAITDHFMEKFKFPIVDTRCFRDEAFTTLLGAELHGPALEYGHLWHILAVGLPLDFSPAFDGETGAALAARAAVTGAFVGIAHPAWYSLTLDDALLLETAHAVEIYNETTAQDNDRGESWYLCDQLALRGRRLFAFASDDTHFAGRPDAFGGWVQVRAERLDPDLLLAALKVGHFYSSQGPELHDIRVEGGRLQVACSPASLIIVSGKGSISETARGMELTSASFPIDRFRDAYCRITVIDAAGKRAWSNPIWLDALVS
jgi:hypothetical protein